MDPRKKDAQGIETLKTILRIGSVFLYLLIAWFSIGTIYQMVKYSGLYGVDLEWAASKQLEFMLAIPGNIWNGLWNFSLADFFIWMVNWPFIIWLIVVIIVLRFIFKD